jgi:hypothetical protein
MELFTQLFGNLVAFAYHCFDRIVIHGYLTGLTRPLFFHKRLCGPLANSRFHHQPDPQHRPNSRLEAAYHRADKAIEHIVELLL